MLYKLVGTGPFVFLMVAPDESSNRRASGDCYENMDLFLIDRPLVDLRTRDLFFV